MQKGQVLIFLLVGILVVAVAGGAYYLGTSQTSKPQVQNPVVVSQSSPTPLPPVTSAKESDGTVDWKTYTNKVIAFEIKYPSGWDYSEVKAGDPLHLYFYPKNISRDPNEALAPMELLILNDSNPLQCLAKDGKSCLDIKIDGVLVKKYSLERFHEVVAFKNKKDDLLFELMSPKFNEDSFAPGSYKEYYESYNLPETERKRIFDQIISTFKFTP